MRKTVLAVLFSILAAPAAFAQISRFTGDWVNTNPNTGGIVRIQVTAAGANVHVHIWGKCSPSPCDWGTRQAIVYGPSPAANPIAQARALTVVFPTNFDEALVVLKPSGPALLTAEDFDRFTDNSGRKPFVQLESFRRR
jgi:hypothetical protein